MEKIPTAEEFYSQEMLKYIPPLAISEKKWKILCGVVTTGMKDWTKLHVKAALEAAHKNQQLPEEDLDFTFSAYPLSNIQ